MAAITSERSLSYVHYLAISSSTSGSSSEARAAPAVGKLRPLVQKRWRYDSAEYNLLQEGKQPKDGIVLVSLQMAAAPLKASLTEKGPAHTATSNRPSPGRLANSSTAQH